MNQTEYAETIRSKAIAKLNQVAAFFAAQSDPRAAAWVTAANQAAADVAAMTSAKDILDTLIGVANGTTERRSGGLSYPVAARNYVNARMG